MTYGAKNNDFPQWAWRTFLYSEARQKDKPRFSALIAERITRYPAESLIKIINPLTSWLKSTSEALAVKFPATYHGIISKLIALIESQPSAVGSGIVRGTKPPDWILEASNSPVGHIAELLISDSELNELKVGEGLPSYWVSYVDKLLALPDNLRRYVLVILTGYWNRLYSIDPQWTEDNLLAVLALDNRDDKRAFWSGFLRGSKIPQPELYRRLKLDMLRLAKDHNLLKKGHEKALVRIILAGWGSLDEEGGGERYISNDEFHNFILFCDDGFRPHLIWLIKEWSKNDDKWGSLLPELLRDVWPKQKMVKTPKTSAALFDLAFSNVDRFNQIADIILPLLSAIKRNYLYLRQDMENILNSYPKQALAIFYKVFSDDAPTAWPYNLEQALDRIAKADKQLRADPRWLELKRKLNDR